MDIQDIKDRLGTLGYTAVAADDAILAYLLSKCAKYIRNYCHITEVPEALREVLTDFTCGEFLREYKLANPAGIGIDASGAIKTISEGDTSVTYQDDATSEARLNTIITMLTDINAQLVPFRKLRWTAAVGSALDLSKIGGVVRQATETILGGIKAAVRGALETVEVKIDAASGKLYVPAQEQSDWDEADTQAAGFIKNKPAGMSFSGSYDDLTGKPTIPAEQVNSDWEAESGKAEILNKPALFSGSYNDLSGKPDLSGYLTAETDPTVPSWAKAEVKPTYTAAEVGALAQGATLDDVADGASRKFSDYVTKETGKGLSTEDYTTDEKTKLTGIAEGAEVNVNADWEAAEGDTRILNKPTLAAVATSGNYSDLSGKPTIPDVSGKQDVSTIVEDTASTDITVTLADNTEYYYGTLTSLSVSLPASGKYQAWVRFTSGTTATSCTFTGITWAGGSVPIISASKTYEISVKDGYGTCQEF